ncbi:Gfo/Idh/MocA family oxidoreductase [Streptomyces sp. SID8379]|uniref:Gfo/Idh/MocA family protein n=1 Tax=unclassified Streptomyces TaxID=2593676 RepID=UPI000381024A|nr:MULTISPECIES: Gfo/Idh/MocA family oxidoreductase [unclassified Streptomyces]MYW63014.1 Gfo/Idh/MocA family oxidoreductase [Streptomyces sp. SID8379]
MTRPTNRSGPVGVGIVGAGNISEQYLTTLAGFPDVEVLIIGDLMADRAEAQARRHGVGAWGKAQDVLAHDGVEIVVNLTVPAVHAEVSSAAVAAGKHVWSEKPIAVDPAAARALLDQAAAAGLRVGVAPDTALGPGVQTARRAIERGDIGSALSAYTVCQSPGPDAWHPSPEFLFAQGAGPLFDMGPYYYTTLITLFGSVTRVSAVGSTGRKVRTIRTGPRAGTEFTVEVPTHVAALASFESGAVSQSVFSFDAPLVREGIVEINGTEGALVVPDPNKFAGDVRVTRGSAGAGDAQWETVESVASGGGRGLGVLDMARAVRTGAPHIATGELGHHVLDVLVAIDRAVATGETQQVASRAGAVHAVPPDRDPYAATL